MLDHQDLDLDLHSNAQVADRIVRSVSSGEFKVKSDGSLSALARNRGSF